MEQCPAACLETREVGWEMVLDDVFKELLGQDFDRSRDLGHFPPECDAGLEKKETDGSQQDAKATSSICNSSGAIPSFIGPSSIAKSHPKALDSAT